MCARRSTEDRKRFRIAYPGWSDEAWSISRTVAGLRLGSISHDLPSPGLYIWIWQDENFSWRLMAEPIEAQKLQQMAITYSTVYRRCSKYLLSCRLIIPSYTDIFPDITSFSCQSMAPAEFFRVFVCCTAICTVVPCVFIYELCSLLRLIASLGLNRGYDVSYTRGAWLLQENMELFH